MPAVHALLRGAIDYAGLFPPAALPMEDAVRRYADYRRGPAAWALGRFVVPATRLAELETAAAALLPRRPAQEPWLLSALAGPDSDGDFRALGEFNCRHAADGAGAASADVVELRAGSVEEVERALGRLPRYLTAYVEIPLDRDPAALVAALARLGGRAKARTGGVTADAFPAPADLARFLAACVRAGVPFKATAGLHHPLRGDYPLTYAPDSPRAPMYGFLNVLLAAAYLRAGAGEADAAALLVEGAPGAFRFDADGVEWRGRRLGLAALAETRERSAIAFGSCSFAEPLDDLAALGLL